MKLSNADLNIKSILFVDDEPDILINYKEYFSVIKGFKVVVASGPDRALLLAGNQIFDVICTDFRMPKMNGGDFINALRNIKSHQNKPVIVITAFPEEAHNACEKLTGIYILAKPVKLKSVCDLAIKLSQLPTSK